jgi:3-deoxy-7-phosphoheptulonate synthase
MSVTHETWTPSGWRAHEAAQQPEWPNAHALERAREELGGLPPLVFAGEARSLTQALGQVAEGKAILLQAGDCAESFHEHSAVSIRERLRILLQMAIVMMYGSGLPVVKVGRMAGQFAKPRTSPTERVGDVDIPSFRGHIVNDEAPTAEARVPDPQRMVRAYHQSASTLNLLRAFTKGGFADLSRVHAWNQEFVAASPEGRRYERLAGDIDRALSFMRACGVELSTSAHMHQVDVWTSHEALLLDYEEALTRQDSLTDDWYDCSAHMLWIGERSRQLDGAHVAFLAGVHNPIGLKVGPKALPEEIVALCERLDPDRTPGRLTLIPRMGAERVGEALPPLIHAVRDAGHPVVWACDPMHGNGIVTTNGVKTRSLEAIMSELSTFVAVCREHDVWPGGVHLEFTGEDVTECIGGSHEVLEDELGVRYMTLCDPRLNARQSLDLAFRISELLRDHPGPAEA